MEFASNPAEVPLSDAGVLFLMTHLSLKPYLAGETNARSPLTVPDYSKIMLRLTAPSENPLALLDALFALGQVAVRDSPQVEFDGYVGLVQKIALSSAGLVKPESRYVAHALASQLFHIYANEDVRLALLKDQLERCPQQNLRVSALEWLREEILCAQKPSSIFASPSLLNNMGEILWPKNNISKFATLECQDDFDDLFELRIVFYLGLVDFIYILAANKTIATDLDLARFLPQIEYNVLEPMSRMCRRYISASSPGDEDECDHERMIADCGVLLMNIDIIRENFLTIRR